VELLSETRFEVRVKEGERPRSGAEVRDLAVALIETFGEAGGLLSGRLSSPRLDVDERKRSEKGRRTARGVVARKRGGRWPERNWIGGIFTN
jgi:hypothetical protein